MINKSASEAATLDWRNDNRAVLWVGSNSNTGETIVWQVVWRGNKPGRAQRITGKNIAKLAGELAALPADEVSIIVKNPALYALITNRGNQ